MMHSRISNWIKLVYESGKYLFRLKLEKGAPPTIVHVDFDMLDGLSLSRTHEHVSLANALQSHMPMCMWQNSKFTIENYFRWNVEEYLKLWVEKHLKDAKHFSTKHLKWLQWRSHCFYQPFYAIPYHAIPFYAMQ